MGTLGQQAPNTLANGDPTVASKLNHPAGDGLGATLKFVERGDRGDSGPQASWGDDGSLGPDTKRSTRELRVLRRHPSASVSRPKSVAHHLLKRARLLRDG